MGIMAHSLLAALGVSALLTTGETAFWAMKLIGGCYLIYLGVESWRNADAASSTSGASATVNIKSRQAPWLSLVGSGFMSNMPNPKVAIFTLAFVLQFVRQFAPQFVRSSGT